LRLDEIPSGSRIFVDSTIFIYHFAGASTACRTLLERCEGGDLKGLTSTVVLAEVAHRLMIVEALTQGLAPVKNLTKKLGEQPDLVRRLHVYQEQIERIPLMGIDVVPLTLKTLLGSREMRTRHGLLVNDSLVAAAALEAGVDGLASADPHFSRLGSPKLFVPHDLS
jgi:predicted nucleic acid-binding protein